MDGSKKVICMAMAFCCLSGTVFAQKVTLTMSNVTVKQAMDKLKNTSGYSFVFSTNDINTNKKISIDAKNKDVSNVVGQILQGQNLDFEIQGKNIIVRNVYKSSNAQEKTVRVKGNVKDITGESITGANVLVKGTTTGTITDIDGNFMLDVPKGAILQVSYIGFTNYEVRITDQKTLSITLSEDSEALDEVVVVGYGIQKKANLSGAVSTVQTKQIENRPVLNVGQALQGTVANLNVSVGTGQAISTPSFNIRGYNSINGGSPLVVIDGVSSSASQLNRMNPNDIASISVLKDASSCAIYGAKAAYGVILVTTKTGKNEKLSINYNNNFSFRQNTRMPDVITDPYTVVTMRNLAYYPWGTCYDDKQIEYAKKVSEDPSISPYYVNPDGSYSYYGQTDWVAEAYRKNAFSTNHSVDLSGKTDKVDYYFSAGYNYNRGMLRENTDVYNRYNLNSKINFKIIENWSISNNTTLTSFDYKAPTNLGSSTFWEINRVSPLDVPKNPDGTWTSSGSDPLGLLADGGDWKQYSTLIRTQFNTRLDIIKDVLFLQGSLSYTTNKSRQQWFYSPVPYNNGPDRPVYYRNEVTSAYADASDDKNLYLDLFGTFHKTFADKHTLTAMVGYNQEEYEYYSHNLSRKDLISTSVPTIGLATGDKDMSEGLGSKATRSAFGRIGYIYDDKYILEFNGRYDGTSIFPKDDRFVFSPSGSAAWVVSKESFFEPLQDVVSFFKLRGSYGQLGNQDLSSYYPYLPIMGTGKLGPIIDGNQPIYVSAPGLVSGSLTWERVTSMNVGADLNLLNNRLSFSGEYYVRRTKDMLTKGPTLPGTLGTSVPTDNAADLKTRGWELTVGYKDQFKVAGKPMNIGANFNIADSRSFITKFENTTGTLYDYYVGYEMGEMWGLTTEGFFTSEQEIKDHADQTPVTSYPGTPPTGPGDLKFADLDGDGIINGGEWTLDDHGDYRIIGNSRPRFLYGLNLNADWNGIDFSVFFQGVGKQNYYPGSGDLYFWGVYNQPWTNITEGNLKDHWSEDNPNGYFPRLKSYVAYQSGIEAAAVQTKYLQNASYLRLKNLSVGYTFPRQWVNKLYLQNLRVFFTGDNLAVWSGLYKYYKCDPEGLGGSGYPLQKSFSFGLNVSF